MSQERVDALASINEGGPAEDFKSFRPLLYSEETEAFLIRRAIGFVEAEQSVLRLLSSFGV